MRVSIDDYRDENPRTFAFDRMLAVMKTVAYLLLALLGIGVTTGCETKKLCFGGACRVGYVYAPTSCTCVPAMDAGRDAAKSEGGGMQDAEDGTADDDGATA